MTTRQIQQSFSDYWHRWLLGIAAVLISAFGTGAVGMYISTTDSKIDENHEDIQAIMPVVIEMKGDIKYMKESVTRIERQIDRLEGNS